MNRRVDLCALVTAGAVLFGAAAPRPSWGQSERVDAVPASPRPLAVLERALDNFNADRRERIRLTNHRGQRTYEREVEVALKRNDDGYRVLGTFTKPEYVRGTSFLILPPKAEKGATIPSNQYFVYLPELQRLRRVGGAQRSDSFFGTYLSQGDVEPHPASHYEPVGMRTGVLDGEPVFELEVRPRFEAGYDRAVFAIAKVDAAILKITQWREGRERPVREILAKREWFEEIGGHVLPARMRVTDGRGRGRTEVAFFDRTVTSDIPLSIFSTSHLLRRGD